MKHFALSAGLLMLTLFACKNTDNNQNTAAQPPAPAAAPAPAPAEAMPVALDMAQLAQKSTQAKENLNALKGLLKQLDGLPASARQNNADKIAILKNDLSGMIQKMQFMVDDLKKMEMAANDMKAGKVGAGSGQISDSGNGAMGDAPQRLKSYGSDIQRYSEDVKNYGDAVKAIK